MGHFLNVVPGPFSSVSYNYILAEWYLSIRANDLWTAYTQKLTAAVATLSSYLFRFYRPVLRRAHRVSPCPEEYSQHGEIQIIDAGLV